MKKSPLQAPWVPEEIVLSLQPQGHVKTRFSYGQQQEVVFWSQNPPEHMASAVNA